MKYKHNIDHWVNLCLILRTHVTSTHVRQSIMKMICMVHKKCRVEKKHVKNFFSHKP